MRAQCRGFESHSVQLIFSNGCSECRFPLLAYPTFSPRDVFMYVLVSNRAGWCVTIPVLVS